MSTEEEKHHIKLQDADKMTKFCQQIRLLSNL